MYVIILRQLIPFLSSCTQVSRVIFLTNGSQEIYIELAQPAQTEFLHRTIIPLLFCASQKWDLYPRTS